MEIRRSVGSGQDFVEVAKLFVNAHVESKQVHGRQRRVLALNYNCAHTIQKYVALKQDLPIKSGRCEIGEKSKWEEKY